MTVLDYQQPEPSKADTSYRMHHTPRMREKNIKLAFLAIRALDDADLPLVLSALLTKYTKVELDMMVADAERLMLRTRGR